MPRPCCGTGCSIAEVFAFYRCMYTLSPLACARLSRLPKLPVVWEGDRRPIAHGMLSAFGYDSEVEENDASDCIIWVDGTEGVLRAVSIVPADTGPEAVARTLLQAMEHPQGAMPPARPHKLVVRDREIQFFLRGALQNLDVAIDHTAHLPLIDDIFDSLEQQEMVAEPELPEGWQEILNKLAQDMWDVSPWNELSDHHIITITLNRWELDTLYVSVLGMLGMEYGLLLYRSEESLKKFRETALMKGRSTQQMQQAFLSQDCLFLNFELFEDEEDTPPIALPWMKAAPSAVEPDFGSIHPLEGLRHGLEVEEAAALRVSLTALHKFFSAHERALSKAVFPTLSANYTLPDPLDGSSISVTVATHPQLTQTLEDMDAEVSDDGIAPDLSLFPTFRDDYIPEGALILLTHFPASVLNGWRELRHYYGAEHQPPLVNEVPMVVIQTSRPKAKKLAEQLQSAQAVTAVCFNPGRDPMTGEQFHLGLLQTGDGEFHLFVEFSEEDPEERRIVQNWHKWQDTYGDRCVVMIASGVTGAFRGKPGVRESVAFFETRSRTDRKSVV